MSTTDERIADEAVEAAFLGRYTGKAGEPRLPAERRKMSRGELYAFAMRVQLRQREILEYLHKNRNR